MGWLKTELYQQLLHPQYIIEEGGLGAALGDDKDNIDAMALKGNINSDDFEVMRKDRKSVV